ncbi:MAG: immunity 53 family protein [Pseudomonadota bacterium]
MNKAALMSGIEAWYKGRCDGDWEHSYGVSITTLDNPGWLVEIDLVETPWGHVTTRFLRSERTDSDWVQSEVKNGRFVGSGGVANLGEILQIFLQIVEPAD